MSDTQPHTLTLVRHGHTQWTDSGEVAGRSDIDLSSEGRDAVTQLARTASASLSIQNWHCSPLQRTRQTTQLLREGMSSGITLPDVQFDDRLVELDFGDWEGMTWAAVHEQYDSEMAAWGEDWINRCPPNGETFAQLVARCDAWLNEQMPEGALQADTLVVLHGGTIRALICLCLGWPLTRAMSFTADLARVSQLSFDQKNRKWVARSINSVMLP